MSTLVVLATSDSALAEKWERQLPAGRTAVRLGTRGLAAAAAAGAPAVVILDAAAAPSLPGSLAHYPTLLVGEPRSHPFEEAKLAGRARAYLSYEESATRLGDLLSLVEELAEKQSMVELLGEKKRRAGAPKILPPPGMLDSVELWSFFEAAVENIDSRERLVGEFRRAARYLLRTSHAVFFLRESGGFRADHGNAAFDENDGLVAYLEAHPAVVDGGTLDHAEDTAWELAVRSRMALWDSRLLVPVHDNGQLLGVIALGVRDDGLPYDEADRARAVNFARLLRHCLEQCSEIGRMSHVAEKADIGSKYLPGTLVLGPSDPAPRHVPLLVRDLIGQVRKTRKSQRIMPTPGQPFRAKAGIVEETGGVWASWEEAADELYDAVVHDRERRRALLREMGLTLNHQLGNALVSLSAICYGGAGQSLPPALLGAVRGDVARLQTLNDELAIMQTLHDSELANVDVREVAQAVGSFVHVAVEVGPGPVVLKTNRKLLEFALTALLNTLGENRPDKGTRDLLLRVRSAGAGAELTALLSIKGTHLELEGILPEPAERRAPTQGRLGVFLAKEIFALNNGDIHAGPGMDGTEILISLRNR